MNIITTTDALVILCDRLNKAEYVTVDTEFLRESTYYSLLCLIQVADSEGAHAIDPLAEGLDLSPFYDLMKNTSVVKVFHACRQDLEIFYKEMGCLPEPMFDTQVAAMVCGYGDSVGYETLVNKMVGEQLDKSTRYTDWSRRPLTERQVTYAIDDVTHLRNIYETLRQRLIESDRGPWLDEEMEMLTSHSTYAVDPLEMWKKIKVRTNKPRVLGLLRELTAWREKRAIFKDMPRRRVMKDEVLLEVAAHPPKDITGLDKIRGLNGGFSRSQAGQEFFEAVQVGIAIPDDQLPTISRAKARPATPPMVDLLKVLLKIRSQETEVAPRLITNAQDLELLAAVPETDLKLKQGWRYGIYGKYAMALIKGQLALSADEKGDIAVVRVAGHEEDEIL